MALARAFQLSLLGLAITAAATPAPSQLVLTARSATAAHDIMLVVRHGADVLGIDAAGDTFVWSPFVLPPSLPSWVATAAPTLSLPSTSDPAVTTRGNIATLWDGASLFEWDGAQWQSVSTSGGPPTAVRQYRIAAKGSGSIILFGGRASGGPILNQTWELDASNVWSQLTPTTSPGARLSPAMACDSNTDNIVLFGGVNASTLGDTWEFDGSTWTLMATTGPTPRENGGMTHWPSPNGMLLVGGLGSVALTDAWLFSSGSWSAVTATYGLNSSFYQSAALHPATDEVVVAGSFGSTPGTVIGTVAGSTNFSTGCVCDGQTNPFGIGMTGTTNLGATFTLTFTNFTSGNPLFVVFDTAAAAPPAQVPFLPTGCLQNIATLAGSALVDANPQPSPAPTISVGVPNNNAALIGFRIFYQGVQLNFSPFNGCSSNGLDVHIAR